MTENEIKLAIEDVMIVRQTLRALGAIQQGIEEQHDAYFQRPGHAEFPDENIRVRSVNVRGAQTYGYFAYKTSLVADARFLRKEEYETRVDNPNTITTILMKLGYSIIDTVSKTRDHYRLGDLNIGVDFIEELGHYIEIEGEDDDILELVKKLGLDVNLRINRSYSSLCDEYRGGSPPPVIQPNDPA